MNENQVTTNIKLIQGCDSYYCKSVHQQVVNLEKEIHVNPVLNI